MLLPMNSPIAGAVILSQMLHGSTFGSMKAGLLILREGYVLRRLPLRTSLLFSPLLLLQFADQNQRY